MAEKLLGAKTLGRGLNINLNFRRGWYPTLKMGENVWQVLKVETFDNVLIGNHLVASVLKEALLFCKKFLKKLDVGALASGVSGAELSQLGLEPVDKHVHAVLGEVVVEFREVRNRANGVKD